MASTVSDDYEHWADDVSLFSEAASAAPRYDSRNGLRRHTYVPADFPKEEAVPEPVAPLPAAAVVAPPVQLQPPPQVQYMPCPHMQYVAHPALAYYGYPGMAAPAPHPIYSGMGYPVYQPPAATPEKKGEAPPERKWQGRTKVEVQEDNMKIAAKEGAWEERKVEPIGLKEDQMVWVVELDGSHTLRCVCGAAHPRWILTDTRYEALT